jgi:hypothetical protein
MSLDLTLYPLPRGLELSSIRLAPSVGGAVLFVALQNDAIAWLPAVPDGKAPRAFSVLQGRLGTPGWDVGPDSDGSWAVVSTDPGSASCGLRFKRAEEAAEIEVSRYHQLGAFKDPRFIRGFQGAATPITAVESGETTDAVVLFLRAGDGSYGAARALWSPPAGMVQQAVVVRHGNGFLMFVRTYIPGTVPVDAEGRLPERMDARGESTLPGVVSCVPLAADFSVSGREVFPLGDRQLFELDADAADGRVVLFAATATGALLTTGAPETAGWRTEELSEAFLTEPLSTPRLAVAQGRVHMAVIASAHTPATRLLTGSHTIATPDAE